MSTYPTENPEQRSDGRDEREERADSDGRTGSDGRVDPDDRTDREDRGESASTEDERLAPSELVRLAADRFASRGRSGAVPLLDGEGHVPARELTLAALAAAVFENERADVVELVAERRSGWLGGGSERLFLARGPADPDWPAYSWEAAVPRLVDRLADERGRDSVEVAEVAYRLLAEEAPDPWLRAVDHVDEGLAARGLLDPARAEGGNQFADARYVVTERAAALLDDREPERLKQRLREVRMYRPDIWSLFEEAVERAVDERTVDEDPDAAGHEDRTRDGGRRGDDGVLRGDRE